MPMTAVGTNRSIPMIDIARSHPLERSFTAATTSEKPEISRHTPPPIRMV